MPVIQPTSSRPPMEIAGILLAAGRSRRFGISNKLAVQIGHLPMAVRTATNLISCPLAFRIAVVADGKTPSPQLKAMGFQLITNSNPDAGLSRSIVLGIEAALAAGAQWIMIALADMPFVPPAHFARLIDAGHNAQAVFTTSRTSLMLPPILLSKDKYLAMDKPEGDRGLGTQLIHDDQAARVALADQYTRDIDVPADLPS